MIATTTSAKNASAITTDKISPYKNSGSRSRVPLSRQTTLAPARSPNTINNEKEKIVLFFPTVPPFLQSFSFSLDRLVRY